MTTTANQPGRSDDCLQRRIATPPPLFTHGLCAGDPLQASPNQYVVAADFDDPAWIDWRNALAASLRLVRGAERALELYCIKEHLYPGPRTRLSYLFERVCGSLFSVFLVSPRQDRSVYLEMGVAVGLGVPSCMLYYDGAPVPSPLQGIVRTEALGHLLPRSRDLADLVAHEAYDVAGEGFVSHLPRAGSLPQYLILAGDTYEDPDVEDAITGAVGARFGHLRPLTLSTELDSGVPLPPEMRDLESLVQSIQASRFGVYRVEEKSSPLVFLALGISMALARPFMLIKKGNAAVPRDLGGIGCFAFPNFTTLRQIADPPGEFFSRYA